MLADANRDRADAIAMRLAESGEHKILRLGDGRSLDEAVAQEAPDVVIVDMARPDRDSLDGIRAVSARQPRPIIMFVDHDDPAFMEAAIEAGVSSYNVIGSALPDVRPIVETSVAMFRRFHKLSADLRRAETVLVERDIVHRAKLLLIDRRRFTEPEAHHWLRRRAMNQGRRIAEIAAEFLGEEERGKDSP